MSFHINYHVKQQLLPIPMNSTFSITLYVQMDTKRNICQVVHINRTFNFPGRINWQVPPMDSLLLLNIPSPPWHTHVIMCSIFRQTRNNRPIMMNRTSGAKHVYRLSRVQKQRHPWQVCLRWSGHAFYVFSQNTYIFTYTVLAYECNRFMIEPRRRHNELSCCKATKTRKIGLVVDDACIAAWRESWHNSKVCK